ncbi:glycoside hydrolase domain-containing protein [Frondihabitans sp. 4ASC-45]|uniref:glycoside hydrolase domain-containing protein n=1 Tax=Frondihabitans sp. 4ASC-45 TaxID=3111636 RepID=UPI003C141C00
MDAWVKKSQEYLNASYVGISGVPSVVADGQPGWQTMFALTRALQHELGIPSKSDSFGPTTLSTLTAKIGDVGKATASSHHRVFALLQCALWCKGYPGGSILGRWDASIDSSLVNVRTNMGLAALPSVSPKMFKSLLTMDAYVVIANGSSAVRAIQQWMNHRYAGRTDYFVVPCDGIFSRDVQRGLMLAIQYEIGMDDGVANGNFGPGTQAGLKSNAHVATGSTDSSKAFVRLFQAALTFNGHVSPFDGSFGSTTQSVVTTFQSFAELPVTGAGDYATWASLLVSTGDPNRQGRACDTSKPLTTAMVEMLKAAGYDTVGRYLSVEGKRLNPGELDVILLNGLSLFPIFQEWNNDASCFTEAAGYSQGTTAIKRARNLGFRAGTTVFFAVDYDATAEEIPQLIVPYFKGVKRAAEASRLVSFRIGIYGTRNVCSQVSAAGLAEASFVGGMSTGYSGNLGFPLPENWTYDQVQEYILTAGSESLPVDKDIKSSRAKPVTSVLPTPVIESGATARYDEEFLWRLGDRTFVAESHGSRLFSTPRFYDDVVLHDIQKSKYWTPAFRAFTPLFEETSAGAGESGRRVAQLREAYVSDTNKGAVPSGRNYGGDFTHFAATARGYAQWGLPPSANKTWESDLGGWALDLVTCFDDYVIARKSGYTAGARAFIASRVGHTREGSFNREDLIADMDGHLTARMIQVDASRSIWDCLREITHESRNSTTWRPRAFFKDRFGSSRANAEGACKHLFEPSVFNLWIALPVGEFSATRLPGQAPIAGEHPLDATERNSELPGVAAGFADALVRYCSDGLPLS